MPHHAHQELTWLWGGKESALQAKGPVEAALMLLDIGEVLNVFLEMEVRECIRRFWFRWMVQI
jgi:hypothetical protein